MPTLDHLHWENLYCTSSPRPSQQQQAHASSHETQSLPLMPVPMAPMQHDTLNNLNLYYLPTARPILHTEHRYYPATRLEDEDASFPLDPTIQSGHGDQMGNVQDLSDPIYMTGASLDHASQSIMIYPTGHGARVPYNTLNETMMNESRSLFSASGAHAVQEVQSHPNITQPDEAGMYHCLWSGCTDKHGFSQIQSLWRHIKAIHLHPGSFECPFPSCEKRYGRADTLQAHQRSVGHFYDSCLRQFDPTRSPSYQVSPRH